MIKLGYSNTIIHQYLRVLSIAMLIIFSVDAKSQIMKASLDNIVVLDKIDMQSFHYLMKQYGYIYEVKYDIYTKENSFGDIYVVEKDNGYAAMYYPESDEGFKFFVAEMKPYITGLTREGIAYQFYYDDLEYHMELTKVKKTTANAYKIYLTRIIKKL